jgi:hypothetical protein
MKPHQQDAKHGYPMSAKWEPGMRNDSWVELWRKLLAHAARCDTGDGELETRGKKVFDEGQNDQQNGHHRDER